MRLWFLCWATACSVPESALELRFVRGGMVVFDGRDVTVNGGEHGVLEAEWHPGEPVEVRGLVGVGPRIPECLPLFHVDLGDVSRWMMRGGSAPDTTLAFDPTGSRLAVGTFLGEVVVIDGWTGNIVKRRHLTESMVKWVAWGQKGTTLFAAEQSPDALLHALDPDTLSTMWSVRLADYVESSAPPAGDDLYGMYTLPGAYGLTVLPDDDVLLAAVHGWNSSSGRKNRSQILRFDATGSLRAAWPDTAADVTLFHPRVDLEGGIVVVPVGHSADGPPPDLPINGVQLLDLDRLTPLTSVVSDPLEPWFSSVFLWEAADVAMDLDRLVMGLGDGRVMLYTLNGQEVRAIDAGAPILAGDVPIASSVGHARFLGKHVLAVTSGTNIPWGTAAPDLRPPRVHPNENTLWVFDRDGEVVWSWRGPYALEGLALHSDGRTVVVGAGVRHADERVDLFGALVFDVEPSTGQGTLEVHCPTRGPVFFRPAVALDERVAVAEYPTMEPDGGVSGAYRVTVFR